MSIFSKIKDAIFGKKAVAAPAPAQAAPQVAPQEVAATAPVAASEPVDVEAVMEALAAAHAGPSNWRVSIVDTMKLLGLDSSLANRKSLALELGYDGDLEDSATMNIWLQKEVFKQLAANGGKVPAGLAD